MPKKNNHPTLKKRSQVKKIRPSRFIIIILAVIIAIAFLVFNTHKPKREQKIGKSTPSVSTSKASPSFRIDGKLSILHSEGSFSTKLEIEIADDEQERMKGLMDRFSLPENAGMLFIFQEEEPRSFWMKNTYISLDIIYINSNMEIVSIQKYTQPQSTSSIPSEKPAMYVLEVIAGLSDKVGINPGDKIVFSRD